MTMLAAFEVGDGSCSEAIQDFGILFFEVESTGSCERISCGFALARIRAIPGDANQCPGVRCEFQVISICLSGDSRGDARQRLLRDFWQTFSGGISASARSLVQAGLGRLRLRACDREVALQVVGERRPDRFHCHALQPS